MNLILKIFFSIISTNFFVIFFFNLYKSIKRKTSKSFIETFSQRDTLSFLNFFIFFDLIIYKIGKLFFEKKFTNFYFQKYTIEFLLNILRNRYLMQDIKEAFIECFLILLFSPRQFSFYSILIFGTFIVSKTIHQAWLQNLIINKEIRKNSSWQNYFIFILFLVCIIHFEMILSKIYLSFYRRRMVNMIVGTEFIFLSTFLKGIIINHLFSFMNSFFFYNKWKFQEACEQFLKVLISFTSIFSFIFALNNLGFSKKGIFKYYIFRRFFHSLKEFFQNLEEFFRFRKTQIFIENIMKNPLQKDIDNLSDSICIICRDEMEPNSSKILPCKHILHVSCLQVWLKRQFNCPICMLSISSSFIKTKKQKFKQSMLSLSQPKINSIAISTGFYHKCKASFFGIKTDLKFYNLPSLFPELNNFLFRNGYGIFNQNPKNKINYFLNLFSEVFERNNDGLGFLKIGNEYFQFIWVEKTTRNNTKH